jgi:2-polyprenyl-3-methyl-5-hydroxy-6-metoxy-1,4-benzoquinol methylase
MNKRRDFDSEFNDEVGRRYAYNFDFDVMHHYMVKAFAPWFLSGSALELGSFKGDFTARLLPFFPSLTCVEASAVAIEEARTRRPRGVTFLEGTFEEVKLEGVFDNILLTHVLEHVEDPVRVLRRINDEWLSESGRLFLVCPNANAPSRQIAVKMGLISHNSAVTAGEAQHGHHRTYSLDTLERDAVAGGLRVVQRSGIFFKALANFQWDKILKTDVISQEYLDGCYALGQLYPDLCASIFLLCEKGRRD